MDQHIEHDKIKQIKLIDNAISNEFNEDLKIDDTNYNFNFYRSLNFDDIINNTKKPQNKDKVLEMIILYCKLADTIDKEQYLNIEDYHNVVLHVEKYLIIYKTLKNEN